MKIDIRSKTTFFYLFLFAGAFSDVLRVGTTQLTLFRVLLPVVVILSLLDSVRVRRLYLIAAVIGLIALVQFAFFSVINEIGVRFSTSRYLTYLFYYFCIVAVIGVVIRIYESEGERFTESFQTYIVFTGICYLVVFMLMRHTGLAYRSGFFQFNNPNDYGAVIAACAPVFYFRARTGWRRILHLAFIPIAMLYLALNDCKLALLGVLVQVVIIAYLELRNRMYRYRKVMFLPLLLACVTLILIADALDLSLNGYSWKSTIMEPIKMMLNGDMYTQSNTSVLYRVNTFIASVQWMFNSCFLGIGIGNAGVLMRNVLGQHGLYTEWLVNESVSLHNAFLEIFLDFGFVALFGAVLLIRKVIRVLKNMILNRPQMCFVTIVISSLLWLQGPSVVLTDYQIFAVGAFCLLSVSEKSAERVSGKFPVVSYVAEKIM